MPAMVPNPVPYISLEDFTVNPCGADLTTFGTSVSNSDAELQSLLLDATAAVDGFCKTTFQYQTRSEKHNWRGRWDKRWEVFPFFGPIRTVTKFTIAVSAHAGDFVEFPVSCLPVQTSTTPPEVFGETFIDREVGYVQTTYIMLKYGLNAAYLSTPINPSQVRLTYTCGYNDPEADPTLLDGYSFPFPYQLVQGTRHIAAWLVNEHNLTQEGMGNIDALKVGDRSARRLSGSGGGRANNNPFDIPKSAQNYLKPFIRTRLVGGNER